MFNMDNEIIDSKFVYIKLFNYLNNIYFQNKLDDLGCLLGDMRLLDDKISCDPAIFQDWENIYTSNQINDEIIYENCILFLNGYATRIKSKELLQFIASIDKEMLIDFIKRNK